MTRGLRAASSPATKITGGAAYHVVSAMTSKPTWFSVLNTAAPGASDATCSAPNGQPDRQFRTAGAHAQRVGHVDKQSACEIACSSQRLANSFGGYRKNDRVSPLHCAGHREQASAACCFRGGAVFRVRRIRDPIGYRMPLAGPAPAESSSDISRFGNCNLQIRPRHCCL